jgi:NAD(P)-dependent dehydrogenase (short-subunit alcohol dehydrogenase family)
MTLVARGEFGRVDIAVNSAGVAVSNLIAEATREDLERACSINFYGNVFFVKYMAEAIGENGAITIVSSMSATHPVAPHMAYACAKAATDCMVRYAAVEYGPKGIRVNSVLPSVVRSEMAGEVFTIPGFEEVFTRQIPLGRVSEPEDLADAIFWLSTSAFATGLNLHISGGNQLTRFPAGHEFPQEELRRHPGTDRPET